jgi:hypothetical protein
MPSVYEPLYGLARDLYAGRLRQPLAETLFDVLDYPLLTRRRLYDDPPDYVADFAEFFDPETVDIGPPRSVGEVPEQLSRVVRSWEFVRPFVTVLENVDLVGPNALPVAPDGAFVVEAADGSMYRMADALVRAVGDGVAPVHRGTGRRRDLVVSLAGPWSSEFFHWFADYLPRLRPLERYERETGISPQVLVPPDRPAWLTSSLAMAGIPSDRVVEWTGGRCSVDRLVVPSMPRQTRSTAPPQGHVHSPAALGWLRDRLLAGVTSGDRPDVGTRLYVSRAHQPTRHVRNESDLLSVADEYGFETVYPERWTVAEQVAAFAEADVVLGPHGAGLFNAIYGTETTLVELFGERTNPCFFAIARGMGMPYATTQCAAVGSDMRVDTDDLRTLLSLAVDG